MRSGIPESDITEETVAPTWACRMPDPELLIRTSGEQRLSTSCCGSLPMPSCISPRSCGRISETTSGAVHEFRAASAALAVPVTNCAKHKPCQEYHPEDFTTASQCVPVVVRRPVGTTGKLDG